MEKVLGDRPPPTGKLRSYSPGIRAKFLQQDLANSDDFHHVH